MNIRKKAHEALDASKATLDDVSAASRQVVATTEWATVALIAVAAVSVLALGIGVAAYVRAGQEVTK
jgi:hypothetical protein